MPWQVDDIVTGKRRSLLMAGSRRRQSVYAKKPQPYAKDNRPAFNCIRSGKSEAKVTVIKDCARGITPLKLTTDGHKASRGLSATAELLVCINKCLNLFFYLFLVVFA